jgi:hypothetical protein
MLTKRARWCLIGGTTAAAFIASASVTTTLIVLGSHPAAVTMRPAAATAPARARPSAEPSRTSGQPVPTPSRTVPAPTPTRTVYVTPPPAQAAAPAPSTSAPAQPQPTNAVAVVLQYYQDIVDHHWSAAGALGGDNIAAQNGQTYDSWVSGYTTTTANIAVTSYGAWDDGTVWTDLSATQLHGSVKTYSGTYIVENGVIVSAHITQTS